MLTNTKNIFLATVIILPLLSGDSAHAQSEYEATEIAKTEPFKAAHSQSKLVDFSASFREYLPQLGTNPDSLVEYLSGQLERVNLAIEKAQAHLLLSLAYNQQVHPKEALIHANQGIKLIDPSMQPWLFHYLQLAKGIAHDLLGDPKVSIELSTHALEWAENYPHHSLLIRALMVRSLAQNTLRNSVEALSDAQRAYSLAPQEDPLIAKATIAGTIALVYEYRGQPERAISYFEEAVDYHRKHRRWRDLGDVLYGLGVANIQSNNIVVGKQQLRESIDVARKVSDIQGVAYGLKQLAGYEFDDGNIEKAESMFKEALDIFKQSGNAFTRSDILMWLSRIALAKQQSDTAFDYLTQAEKLINAESMASHYYRLQEEKAAAYEAIGDIEMAYKLIKENTPKRLKMLRKTYVNQFEELKNEFEFEKLDSKNRLLEKDNLLKTSILEMQVRKNQYLYLFALLTLVICLLLAFILYKSRQSKRKFEQLSMIDELTQLANRRNLFQMLKRQIALSFRHNEDLTIAVVDLDFFKRINDEFGHSMGDSVLVEFAKLCRETLRKTDLIGRIGGEEFLVALPKTNLQKATLILNKLKNSTIELPKRCPQLAPLNEKGGKLSISIGITQLMETDSSDKLFIRADEALYKAKENGRNQIQAA